MKNIYKNPTVLISRITILIIVVIVSAGIFGAYFIDIIRSYGNGATHYAKGHLSAVSALDHLAWTEDESYFTEYRRRIHPTLSVGIAREILNSADLPVGNSYPFLIEGNNHPDDVAGIAWLYRTFKTTPIFAPAQETWRSADRKIDEIDALADQLLASVRAKPSKLETRLRLMREIDRISNEVLALENRFTLQMGAVARNLRTVLFAGLAILGLLLALLIWRLGVAARRKLARADRAVRDRERRLEDIVEVAADWVWETDSNHRFTFISPRLEQVVGVSTDVFLGQRRRQNAAIDDTDNWGLHEEDLAARRAFRDFEYVFQLPDGRERHFRINGKPVFGEHGGFKGYRGTGSDITEAVEARHEAGVKQGLLEATFQHIAQGISVVDANMIAMAFNDRFLELLEFPSEQFSPGDPFEAFVRFNAKRGEYGPGDVDTLVAERMAQAARFEPHDFERTRPDGTVIEIRGRPLPWGGFVTTYTDVTDRNRVLEELRSAKARAEAANQAKTMFLANISHELRTPLNAVIGFSDLLVQRRFGELRDIYAEYAGYINDSGQHLLAVINDILDLAKIDTGQISVSPEPLPPRRVTESCLRFFQERAASSGISLVNEVLGDAPFVHADERLLRQILLNLIGNAVKFSNAGGRVTVRHVVGSGGMSGFAVSDNGIGMKENQIAKALQPFEQLNASYDRVYEGVGLGLSLVQRYMDLHGGRLDIASAVNRGTTVTILFPVQAT